MWASIWIGWDPREQPAYEVARNSAKRHMTIKLPVNGLVLQNLRRDGLYTRPTETKITSDGRHIMHDVISEAPMSTEFAISRFLVPHLAKRGVEHPIGWALFMDCDVLVRTNLVRLFEEAQKHPEYAVMCVKHNHAPPEGVKMDGQEQTRYARKNWSSVMLFNIGHHANKELTPDLVNSVPGRDLHRFCWLDDGEIGELGPEYNFLVRHTKADVDPKIVHFTDGYPLMPGYENDPYADEWRAEQLLCAA